MKCFSRYTALASFLMLGITTAGASESILIIPEQEDFGTVLHSEMAYGSFSIISKSSEDISLNILAGCSCMSVIPGIAELESGESLLVNWTLDTEKYSGEVSFDIIIMGAGDPLYHKVEGLVKKEGVPIVFAIALASALVLMLAALLLLKRRTGKHGAVSRQAY